MCHDELTLMMYADGELPNADRLAIDAHLRRCGRCLALVASLDAENQTLSEVMLDAGWSGGPLPAEARPADPVRVPRALAGAVMAATVGSTAVLRLLVESVTAPTTPAGLTWLNPFHDDGLGNMLFNAAVYVVQEGGSMMSSLAAAGGAAAVSVLALSGAAMLARRMDLRSGVAGLVGLCTLASAAPIEALEVRRSEGVVVVASTQTIDDTLVAMGESVEVDGTVTGDLIAMGRRVRIRGTVNGSVFAFAQVIDVDGAVEGGVFQFGQTLTIRGQAARSLYAFGQTVEVLSSARVAGNATTFSQTATIDGHVGQDVTSFGQRLDVAGTVDRRVTAYGERVTILPPARIGGQLTAYVRRRENVRIEAGATVQGTPDIRVRAPEPSRYQTASFYLRQAIRLAAAFVTGWVLFWLVPPAAAIRLETGRRLFTAAGVGAVSAVATPLLALIAGLTLIGLPVALFAILVWLVGLYLAKIVLAVFLGRVLLGERGERGVAGALLIGLTVIVVTVNLPYVGGLINVLLTVTGLGALVVEAVRQYRSATLGVRATA